jgi:hypothetical protein
VRNGLLWLGVGTIEWMRVNTFVNVRLQNSMWDIWQAGELKRFLLINVFSEWMSEWLVSYLELLGSSCFLVSFCSRMNQLSRFPFLHSFQSSFFSLVYPGCLLVFDILDLWLVHFSCILMRAHLHFPPCRRKCILQNYAMREYLYKCLFKITSTSQCFMANRRELIQLGVKRLCEFNK